VTDELAPPPMFTIAYESPDPRLMAYTVAEAAEALRVSPDTVYRLVHRGELPYLRLGRRIVIPRERLERLVRGETA
jgi:excisionase family DNA binding protein